MQVTNHHIHPNATERVPIHVSKTSAAWKYLSFQICRLAPGERLAYQSDADEAALVPIQGTATVHVSGEEFRLSRPILFADPAQVFYAPPRVALTVEAETEFEFAIGSAPAEGKYPVRLITGKEIRAEIRGGGTATRQVNHLLSYPLPAERLILYEVFLPGGNWAGWPPHCHDGFGRSPYLEETYYFRIDPSYSFGLHRNWRTDLPFEELYAIRDGDLVLVTQGFHSTIAAPNSRLYFLNYLAGDLYDDQRQQPPYDEPAFAWIKRDWTANKLDLPVYPL